MNYMIARRLMVAVLVLFAALRAQAATLTPEARAAYERYVAQVEARLAQQHQSTQNFIVVNEKDAETKLSRGKVLLQRFKADQPPGAMIHHWSATMLVPGATAADFLRVVRDYDHYPEIYGQHFTQAKVLQHEGDDYELLTRVTQHRIVTVVLDVQSTNQFGALDATHGYITSRSTDIREIADPGKSTEHALPPGQEHGFLWSLNLYWSYEERPEGLLVQCETVSLTRDIPWGLGWLIKPLVQSVPRDALTYTLTQTRNEMLRTGQKSQGQPSF
ncbi:MAG TPA: hypothetical protein VMU24_06655 [Candidatus Acidoferrales bacterium]|nr:hypothetical protein [Candidatus Acidoferrales bacterium]